MPLATASYIMFALHYNYCPFIAFGGIARLTATSNIPLQIPSMMSLLFAHVLSWFSLFVSPFAGFLLPRARLPIMVHVNNVTQARRSNLCCIAFQVHREVRALHRFRRVGHLTFTLTPWPPCTHTTLSPQTMALPARPDAKEAVGQLDAILSGSQLSAYSDSVRTLPTSCRH